MLGATLVLAGLPYLYGWLIRPPGALFWAVPPINGSDANQYLAFTRMAAHGLLLFDDPFTAEPHPPRLFLPQALLQGLAARLCGGSLFAGFHLSRLLSGAALLLAAWGFGRRFLRPWRRRRLYLVLLCWSAGIGWMLEAWGVRLPNGDWLQPEGNTFFTLTNLPHLALAQALLIVLVGRCCAERAPGSKTGGAENQRDVPGRRLAETETREAGAGLRSLAARAGLRIAALSALLAWTHPFDFLTLGAVAAAWFLLRARAGRPPLQAVWQTSRVAWGATVLGAAPAAIYLLCVLGTDPVYRALAQDGLRVEPPAFYLAAHLPLGLLALPVLLRPERRSHFLLPLCWVGVVFLGLLLPVSLGGKLCRLVGGVHVPLALLAAAGTDMLALWVRRWVRRGPSRDPRRRRVLASLSGTLVRVSLVVFLLPGAPAMALRHAEQYHRHPERYFLPPELQAALRALDFHGTPDQITLAGPLTGGWAPVAADARSWHGHWHMTLDASRKARERLWFFLGDGAPRERAAWLRRQRIRWVLVWPTEWLGQLRSVAAIPGLSVTFAAGDVVLYQFDPGQAPEPDE